MADTRRIAITRRSLLQAATGMVAGAALTGTTRSPDMPEITRPRATSGDGFAEPDWEHRLTVTVGHDGADLCGASDKVIQAAVDYVARLGGGTVRVLPGEYSLRNSVFLAENVRLLGSGTDSALLKGPCRETTLAANSDWYEQEVTLEDASGFEVGDGVCLITDNPHHGGRDVLKRTLVARSGNRFKLDTALRKNFWTEKAPQVLHLFPLLTAEYTAGFAVEDIALDGNRANNPFLDGNHSGCIWLQDCSDVSIRGVTARNQNGDGISFQICHDVLVENCHLHDNASLGLHPGSGSQRPVIRNNRVERNKIGLFFCWGSCYGLAEKNTIADSLDAGISIGHRDNENLIRDNDITGSGKTGVLFRGHRKGFLPTGNRVEGNRIIDNGPEDGAAVDIQGAATRNTIARNTIREARTPAARIGIRIGPDADGNQIAGNTIEGFSVKISDLSKG